METLRCDVCGGTLEMKAEGNKAICKNCGTEHPMERLQKKMIRLADCYAEGVGVEKDEAKALSLYKELYTNGEPEGRRGIVGLYSKRNDLSLEECKQISSMFSADMSDEEEKKLIQQYGYPIALKMIRYKETLMLGYRWIGKCASAGNAEAWFVCGELYLTGQHTRRDMKKALYCLNKAVEQNHAGAKALLAVIASGRLDSLTKDHVVKLLRKHGLTYYYEYSGTKKFEAEVEAAKKTYAVVGAEEEPLLVRNSRALGVLAYGLLITDRNVYYYQKMDKRSVRCPICLAQSMELRFDKLNTAFVCLIMDMLDREASVPVYMTVGLSAKGCKQVQDFWKELLCL